MEYPVLVFCNSGQEAEFPEGNFAFVTNLHEAGKAMTSSKKMPFGGLLVFAELQWKGYALSDTYGLQILKDIRQKWRRTEPILLLSLLPKHLLQTDYPENWQVFDHYLTDPAIKVLSITEIELMPQKEVMEMFPPKLSNPQLADLCQSLYSPQGYLSDRLYHVMQVVAGWTDSAHQLAQLYRNWSAKARKLLPEIPIPNNEPRHAQAWLSHLIGLQKNLAQHPIQPSQTWSGPGQPHLLLINPQPLQMGPLIEGLKELGIKVTEVMIADEAIQVLKYDQENQVVMIMYPNRIYDPKGRPARQQGYDLVRHLSKLHHIHRSMIWLAPGENQVEKAGEMYPQSPLFLELDWKMSGAINKVFRAIVGAKNWVEQELAAKGHFGGGENGELYAKFYHFHRNHPTYANWENWCNHKISEALPHRKNKEKFKKILFEKVGARLKNQDELNEESLKKFRNKFFYRRLALALYQLYFEKGIDPDLIWIYIIDLLRYWEERYPNTGDSENRLSDFLNTHLRLFRKDNYYYKNLPHTLLTLEEKQFLEASFPELLSTIFVPGIS